MLHPEEVRAFANTLGSADWIRANENRLKEVFPENWTDARHVNLLRIASDLRLIGIPWTKVQQVPNILAFLERIKIIERIGDNFRRNPRSLFATLH